MPLKIILNQIKLKLKLKLKLKKLKMYSLLFVIKSIPLKKDEIEIAGSSALWYWLNNHYPKEKVAWLPGDIDIYVRENDTQKFIDKYVKIMKELLTSPFIKINRKCKNCCKRLVGECCECCWDGPDVRNTKDSGIIDISINVSNMRNSEFKAFSTDDIIDKVNISIDLTKTIVKLQFIKIPETLAIKDVIRFFDMSCCRFRLFRDFYGNLICEPYDIPTALLTAQGYVIAYHKNSNEESEENSINCRISKYEKRGFEIKTKNGYFPEVQCGYKGLNKWLSTIQSKVHNDRFIRFIKRIKLINLRPPGIAYNVAHAEFQKLQIKD